MKKAIISSSIIVCLLGIYNVLIFSFCENFNKNFWATYILVTVSMIIMLASYVITFSSKKRDQVTGLPITTLSAMYAGFEILLGSIFMFFNLSFKAVFLPQIICFIIFLAIYIPALVSLLWKKEEKSPTESKE